MTTISLALRQIPAILWHRFAPAPNGREHHLPADALHEIAPAPAPAPANQDLARILSPSQVSTWRDCQAAWMFRYFHHLPDRTDADRALGSAIDATLSANFRQKIWSKKDLTREQALKIFAAMWKHFSAAVAFDPDDNPDELKTTGEVLVQKYMAEYAADITPIAVQLHLTGQIAGVAISAYVDLMTSDGVIVDWKVAKKSPSGMRPNHIFQLATYRQLAVGASGKVQVHTLIRTKNPKIVVQNYEITPADIRWTETTYPLVQEAARTGLFIPNRESMFCSRAKCAWWKACEEEFGGTVEE